MESSKRQKREYDEIYIYVTLCYSEIYMHQHAVDELLRPIENFDVIGA